MKKSFNSSFSNKKVKKEQGKKNKNKDK